MVAICHNMLHLDDAWEHADESRSTPKFSRTGVSHRVLNYITYAMTH